MVPPTMSVTYMVSHLENLIITWSLGVDKQDSRYEFGVFPQNSY